MDQEIREGVNRAHDRASFVPDYNAVVDAGTTRGISISEVHAELYFGLSDRQLNNVAGIISGSL